MTRTNTADTKAILQANAPYQAFRAAIEQHAPDDHMGTATTAMQAPHAAGCLFLNKLMKSDTLFTRNCSAPRRRRSFKPSSTKPWRATTGVRKLTTGPI
jgi:hypothetical protein